MYKKYPYSSVNRILFLFGIVCLASCKPQKVDTEVAVINDSTMIDLNQYTIKKIHVGDYISSKPLASQLVQVDGKGKYLLMDNGYIYQFDWESGTLEDSIPTAQCGTLGNFSGFTYLNADRVLVYNDGAKMLLVINDKGEEWFGTKRLKAPEEYEKGSVILSSGSPVRSLGLVVSGRAEIVRDDYWGNRQVIGTVGPGELFGEAYACIQGEPLMVSVLASERCEILFLEIQRVFTVCSPACGYHSRLIRNLLTIMARKNLMLTRKIDHMSQRTIREKVMAYLSCEAERWGNEAFEIPFNRQQLADYLAVDRSALSAELSRMQKDGLIEYEKNRFRIIRR